MESHPIVKYLVSRIANKPYPEMSFTDAVIIRDFCNKVIENDPDMVKAREEANKLFD